MLRKNCMYLAFIFLLSWQTSFAQNGEKIDIVDDFEDGDLTNKWGLWIVLTDRDEGGTSWGKVVNFRDGYRSQKGAYITYEVGEKFVNKKTGKKKDAFVLPGLMVNRAYLKSHISGYDGIQFQVKGREHLLAWFLTDQGGGLKAFFHKCTSSKTSWSTHTLRFSDFKGFGNSEKVDKKTIFVIGVSASPFENVTKQAEFYLDNFAFFSQEKKRKKVTKKKKKRIKLKSRYFGDLKVYAPSTWKWKTSEELNLERKGTALYFRAIRTFPYGRIPFVGGITADPNNAKQLMKGTIAELHHLGFGDIGSESYKKVSLKNFRSRRFTFKATPPEIWANILDLLGMGRDVFVQVDFIKYRATTYRILSLMPQKIKTEVLPTVNTILRNIQKNK